MPAPADGDRDGQPGETFETPPAGLPPPAPTVYQCPECGEDVAATPGAVARLIDCPACEERFLIPAENGSTVIPEDPEPTDEEREAKAESELDGLRMRHVVVVRRAAMRSRTYAIIGAAGCLLGVAKLAIMTWKETRGGTAWGLWPVTYVGVAIAALFGAAYFLRRAAHWQRESLAGKIPDPETPPDFSTLSDGSQHARNLEDLR
jgi:DNA-directed RNA polymerase subunit RPC12/RpoP